MATEKVPFAAAGTYESFATPGALPDGIPPAYAVAITIDGTAGTPHAPPDAPAPHHHDADLHALPTGAGGAERPKFMDSWFPFCTWLLQWRAASDGACAQCGVGVGRGLLFPLALVADVLWLVLRAVVITLFIFCWIASITK